MSKKIFVSNKIIAYALLSPSFILIITFILFCLGNHSKFMEYLVVGLILYITLSSVISIILHNAFSVVEIDTKYIKNKHIQIEWEEIGCVKTFDVELMKFSLLPTIEISFVCLSKEKESCSFWRPNKKCIFFAMTKKNLNIISKFSDGKSVILNGFLSCYDKE